MKEPITFEMLSDIRKISDDFRQLGGDFIFARISPSWRDVIKDAEPLRVSGISLVLLLEGSLSLELNAERYDLGPKSFFAFSSSSVIKIINADWDTIDAYMLCLSIEFLQDMNINLNTIDFSMMHQKPNPVIDNLNPIELKTLTGYMELLSQSTTQSESIYTKNAARTLIQALMYQLMQVKWDHRDHQTGHTEACASRRANYVTDFMRLVQIHHFHERSLTFYADRLFISPKYLSRIIKEATGRSAADWIDQFVLLEAKNMLRFSNKNIQQVAYALNFTTQSSFGKFFKHLAGMSPSDYQKS